jgi:hypothetical protein
VPAPQRCEVLGYFERRFGIPLNTFSGYRLLERRKAYLIVRDSSHLESLAGLKVQSVGLIVLRKMRHHLKPTTAALQRFGHLSTQHRFDLAADQLTALLQNGELALDLAFSPGYVVLSAAGHVLGCALYTPGRLRSQIPRRLIAQQQLPSTLS